MENNVENNIEQNNDELKFDFAQLKLENNGVNIDVTNSKDYNAINIKFFYNKKLNLYHITGEIFEDLYVTHTSDLSSVDDIMIGRTEKDIDIDEETIVGMKEAKVHKLFDEILVEPDDFYVQGISNEYSDEKDYYIYLKRGKYRKIKPNKFEYFTNNVLITKNNIIGENK